MAREVFTSAQSGKGEEQQSEPGQSTFVLPNKVPTKVVLRVTGTYDLEAEALPFNPEDSYETALSDLQHNIHRHHHDQIILDRAVAELITSKDSEAQTAWIQRVCESVYKSQPGVIVPPKPRSWCYNLLQAGTASLRNIESPTWSPLESGFDYEDLCLSAERHVVLGTAINVVPIFIMVRCFHNARCQPLLSSSCWLMWIFPGILGRTRPHCQNYSPSNISIHRRGFHSHFRFEDTVSRLCDN